MNTYKAILILLIFLFLGASALPALDDKSKVAIIEEVSRALNDSYVFPETAKKMEGLLQAQYKKGAYTNHGDPAAFAGAISDELRALSKDKHLSFQYNPEGAEGMRRYESRKPEEAEKERESQLAFLRHANFGFRKVERLEGNVGYLAFDFFASAAQAGETAAAALNFLSGCDALIVDLTKNGGGDPTLIQFISSYFFDEPVHLNDIYTRRNDSTENFWTLPFVPGRKMAKVEIYVLTSSYTFSGAEEFTYNLKNLKRAAIIGETTGGGAHPVERKIIAGDYILTVPFARAINPISKTNWEGTGVAPDVPVPAAEAFGTAYRMALEKILAKATGDEQKAEIDWVLTGLKYKGADVKLSAATLQSYAGVYQDRKVMLEDGALYYQRTGPRFKLAPMTETLFALYGHDDFRLEFVVRDGKTVEVIGHYPDGRHEPSKRTD